MNRIAFRVVTVLATAALLALLSHLAAGETKVQVSETLDDSLGAYSQPVRAALSRQSTAEMEIITQLQEGAPTAIAAEGNHIYVASAPWLSVLDVRSKNNPVEIVRRNVFAGFVMDMIISGGHLFIANGSHGLRVFDISRSEYPREVGKNEVFDHVRAITSADEYLYVSATFHGVNGLGIVPASDPTNQNLVNFTPTAYSNNIFVSDHSAYQVSDNTLMILDVSIPSEARLQSTVSIPGISSSSTIMVHNQYAYITHIYGNDLTIINIADPTHPAIIGTHSDITTGNIVGRSNNVLYMLALRGLTAVDISDPTNLGVFRELPSVSGIDAAVSDQFIYTIGSDATLQVVDVSNPFGAAEVGGFQWPRITTLENSFIHQDGYLMVWQGGFLQVIAMPPLSPTFASFRIDASDAVADVETNGTFAFVAYESELVIYDINDPQQTREVSSLGIYSDTFSRLYLYGDYLYVIYSGSLQIIDVSDPNHPRTLGFDHFIQLQEIAIVDNIAYAGKLDGGIAILDVSDPGNPKVIRTVGDVFVETISIYRDHAYVSSRNPWQVHIFNLSNPTDPEHVATINVGCPTAHIDSDSFRDDYAFVQCGSSSTIIVDISIPSNPRPVGRYQEESTDILATRDYVLSTSSEGLNVLWFSEGALVIIPTSGGNMLSSLDSVTYSFAPGTFPVTTSIAHRPRLSQNVPHITFQGDLLKTFENAATDSIHGTEVEPVKPYSITLDYSEVARLHADDESLVLLFWDGSRWLEEPTSEINSAQKTLTARPNRFGLWGLGMIRSKLYMPAIYESSSKSSPPIDLTIKAFEVTQAIQDIQNSVPLVEGRRTMLRVYSETDALEPSQNVHLLVVGLRDGIQLPGSPIIVGPWAVFPSSSRRLFGSSYNIELPSEWLSGRVTLGARIDPNDAIPEMRDDNNVKFEIVDFHEVPPLDLKIVPIDYTHLPSGTFYQGPTDDLLSDDLLRSFPVSEVHTSFRESVQFAGDLRLVSDWLSLLNYISEIKLLDGASESQIYYGLLPRPRGLSFAIAGLGWIGRRASIGFHGVVAEHEIGHNLGRLHAPCGIVGETDPSFPYPDASIGEFGLDIEHNMLIKPAEYHDTMSYCWPTWFSDYTYRALYYDQLVHGHATASGSQQNTLVIRVRLHSNGNANFLPVYVVPRNVTKTPKQTKYVIELVGPHGQLVASHAVPEYRVEEQGVEAIGIYAAVPLPSQELVAIRLVHNGAVIATRMMNNQPGGQGPSSLGITLSSGAEVVVANVNATPMLLRYSSDEGQTWTTFLWDVEETNIRIDRTILPNKTLALELRPGDTTSSLRLRIDIPSLANTP